MPHQQRLVPCFREQGPLAVQLAGLWVGVLNTPANMPHLHSLKAQGTVHASDAIITPYHIVTRPLSACNTALMPVVGCVLQGGETEALKRLQHYLWDTDLIAKYFEIRNGMLGADYSTKFAPWMAAGCLSPRTIYHQVKKYEEQRTANKSTYWVIFELIWRDFFRCV